MATSAQVPPPRAETVRGEWYADGWTSPYLCLVFPEVPASHTRLHLRAFRPAVSPDFALRQDIVVRSGAEFLIEFTFSRLTSQVLTLSIPLPPRDSTGPLPISLRVSRPLIPVLPDKRSLGVVLLDLYPVCHD